jgi:hypothetical protein
MDEHPILVKTEDLSRTDDTWHGGGGSFAALLIESGAWGGRPVWVG